MDDANKAENPVGIASLANQTLYWRFRGHFPSLRLAGNDASEVEPALWRIWPSILKEVVVCGSRVQEDWVRAVVRRCHKS